MKFNTILFDLDETLLDFKKTEKEALNSLFNILETTHSTEVLTSTYKIINKKIWGELEDGKITPDELHFERFNRLKNELNLIETKEFLAEKYTYFLSQGAYVFNDSKEILDYLKDKYTLGAVTNGLTVVQKERLRLLEFDKYFKKIIISQEVGYSKPNPKIFEIAFNELNITEKEKVLMIGDSLNSDIFGGNSFGIKTCYCNFNNIENTSNIKPTYEINSLLKLKEIL